MNSTPKETNGLSPQTMDFVEMQGKDNPSFTLHANDAGEDSRTERRVSETVTNVGNE